MIINPELLKAGNFIEVTPIGLLCTLKYSDKGILEKVYTTIEDIKDNTKALKLDTMVKLESEQIIPQRIKIPNGPTYIQGVLAYSGKTLIQSAELCNGLNKFFLSDIEKNTNNYAFYAANISNPIIKYIGALPTRNRLEVSGFKTLPGYSISQNMKDSEFANMINNKYYPFKFPLIQGYFNMDTKDVQFVPAGTFQTVIKEVNTIVDEQGEFKSLLHNKDVDILVSYTDVCNFNIQPGTYIIVDNHNNIIYSEPTDLKSKEKLPREVKCPVCGKLTTVPGIGKTSCSDPHCTSKLYTQIKQFLYIMGLDEMSFEEFNEYVKKAGISCLPDIFTLDKYKDTKIESTLAKVLHAVIPIAVSPSEEFFDTFISSAGSLESTLYYLHNPSSIQKDLKVNMMIAERLIKWLSDSYNVLMVDTFVNMNDIITIKVNDQKFEGAPIFRNKTICILGRFRHGDLGEIMSILQSYSAKVVTSVTSSTINKVQCILVGNLRGEDPETISLAQAYNIPIYEELQFFKEYDIDSDIKKLAK